ncbi:unnamed protein product [Darwinula stevensoni]|uniref:Uncharacterized protein n=1 Tax=Darwinula stevensoni TaxID=69355 RepID=A0A7R9A336_9CRUS|nr:unnamed protein product [Darwinula stevensoni]CAG0880500.1 unnamed protein product [Darwinula stevensoni]
MQKTATSTQTHNVHSQVVSMFIENLYQEVDLEREEQRVKMEILAKELEFMKCKVREDDVLIKELQSSAACSQEMVAELTNTLHFFSPLAVENEKLRKQQEDDKNKATTRETELMGEMLTLRSALDREKLEFNNRLQEVIDGHLVEVAALKDGLAQEMTKQEAKFKAFMKEKEEEVCAMKRQLQEKLSGLEKQFALGERKSVGFAQGGRATSRIFASRCSVSPAEPESVAQEQDRTPEDAPGPTRAATPLSRDNGFANSLEQVSAMEAIIERLNHDLQKAEEKYAKLEEEKAKAALDYEFRIRRMNLEMERASVQHKTMNATSAPTIFKPRAPSSGLRPNVAPRGERKVSFNLSEHEAGSGKSKRGHGARNVKPGGHHPLESRKQPDESKGRDGQSRAAETGRQLYVQPQTLLEPDDEMS